MSDDSKLDTALSRIAAMEAELSGFRSRKEPAPAPQFDQDKFRSAFFRDPVGMLRKMGASEDQIQHSIRVHVAHGLGDQAPAELKVLASMGPQFDATQALASQVTTLSQQLESLTAAQKQNGERERFNALITDKQKYPNLAKALAADSKFVDDDFKGHRGSAEELAAAVEARLTKVAQIFVPQTASEGTADTTGQSTKANAGTGGDPPPLPKAAGVWDEAEHNRVRDELVRKYSSQ